MVAIVGNAAEHWVAVYFALRDKMDLSVNIAIGSSAQIALFVAPVLVLASFAGRPVPDGPGVQRVRDRRDLPGGHHRQPGHPGGESTWFEGLQLLAMYAVLGPDLLLRDLRAATRPSAAASGSSSL